ncbi:MAG: ribosome maturation factor RimP [Alphaproteobacteria bacterium]|nr:ribosome maturation factor RimP [Alphaproteobacteria bacterium]
MSTRQDEVAGVEHLIAPSVEAMGYALVRVRFMGDQQRPTLQVMAERMDGAEMCVDDCAELSRTISALLDVEDPLPGSYLLEVSSPGIDRPLVKAADFERFAGHEAKLECRRAQDGRKRFRGRLLGLEGEVVRLALADGSGETAEIPLADLAEAKLVLTDELIETALKRRGG